MAETYQQIEKERNTLRERVDKLHTRIAKLEEALRFYAEEDYIEWMTDGSPDEDHYEDVDHGEVARRALDFKEG